MYQPRDYSLFDDAFDHYPDAEDQLVLHVVRAWFHPQCRVANSPIGWKEVLLEAGVPIVGIRRFNLLMNEWSRSAHRRLDIRCRCAGELASDEFRLLQVIGGLQQRNLPAENALLTGWFSLKRTDRLLHLAESFAITLADAGFNVRIRPRRINYFH
jgi:hypothetical protein